MKIVGRVAQFYSRSILCGLVFLCTGSLSPAQATASPAGAAVGEQAGGGPGSAAFAVHGIVELDGPWRFQIGDDPRWADPNFDDSAWPAMTLDKSLAEQGLDSYAGYAWYRLRLQPQQLQQLGNFAGNSSFDLLVTSHWIGQLGVYVNGVEAGHTRGMTESPKMYQSPPFAVHGTRTGGDGAVVVAIRSWAAPGNPITQGLVAKVEAGAHDDIAEKLAIARARHWDEHVIAGMIVSFLFFSVAALGAILYLAQRHHSEYLWLSLLCLSVAMTGGVELADVLALMPSSLFDVLNLWMGRIFMAVTLEFVLRFTATEDRSFVRAVQIAILLMPVLSLIHLQQAYYVLSVSAEVVFCATVCVLLFRAWRRGLREAGVMLLPFFLGATADSIDTVLDYLAQKHWISSQFASHRYYLGPIEFSTSIVTYTIFLGSLIAVILYRFVRVSQEEQRSTAEIAAARSVQALLIPTELPSDHYFMLESAYVPVNGVGGDFFQVLPVEDGSILIVVGDVSGKGLQAAMNASTLVGAFRNELSHEPATILNHLNHVLLGAASGLAAIATKDSVASFATCLCARIYRDGTMTVANAGHLSPYRDGREMELSPGLPLGVIGGITYDESTFQLEQGVRLIFLSDGVVEATNSQGELFGFERTQQVSNEPARYIAQTAKRFGQTDDITVVSVYVASREVRKPTREVTQVR